MAKVASWNIDVHDENFKPKLTIVRDFVYVTCSPLKADATVNLEDRVGRLGFAQIVVRSKDEAKYRGLDSAGGSGKLPLIRAAWLGTCHDYTSDPDFPFLYRVNQKQVDFRSSGGNLEQLDYPACVDLADPTQAPRNKPVMLQMVDGPSASFVPWKINPTKDKVNHLYQVERDWLVCTLLIVWNKQNVDVIGHFIWKMTWVVNFEAIPVSPNDAVPRENEIFVQFIRMDGSNVSFIFRKKNDKVTEFKVTQQPLPGRPAADSPFVLDYYLANKTDSCNRIIKEAGNAEPQWSNDWIE